MSDEKESAGKKRERSPNYPAIGLRDAVEHRVRKLYKADGRPGSPIDTAIKHFGYASPHGQALAVVSALKKFGLVEDRHGRIVPTSLAINILEYGPENSEHIEAKKQAALKPEIYAEIVEQYSEHQRLPSDDALRSDLIVKKKFNPKAVTGFLKDFRDTLEYAGLLEGNTLKLSTAARDEADLSIKKRDPMTAIQEPPLKNPPAKDSAPSITFPLSGGNVIEIRLRSKLSMKDFVTVKKLIELSEDSLVDPQLKEATE
ncbi:MAG: hypothetical protein ACJ8FY_13070 [Gemmataceae bacterium]